MEVADRLRITRKKLGFSQAEFATGLGLQQGSYSDIERGKVKNFSESFLLLLELNFGINSKYILFEEGEPLLTKRRETVREEAPGYETVQSLLAKLKERDATIVELNRKIEELTDKIEKIKNTVG